MVNPWRTIYTAFVQYISMMDLLKNLMAMKNMKGVSKWVWIVVVIIILVVLYYMFGRGTY